MRIRVGHHHAPYIDIEPRPASYNELIRQLGNIRYRPEPGLLMKALGDNVWRRDGSPTDAAKTLYSDDGDWSGAYLRGRARQNSKNYVVRRRALADRATKLGLGRLIQVYPGHGNGRLVWRWSELATERCREIITEHPPLAAEDEDALALLTN